MSDLIDPPRLLGSSADPAVRAALAAGKNEQASALARAKALSLATTGSVGAGALAVNAGRAAAFGVKAKVLSSVVVLALVGGGAATVLSRHESTASARASAAGPSAMNASEHANAEVPTLPVPPPLAPAPTATTVADPPALRTANALEAPVAPRAPVTVVPAASAVADRRDGRTSAPTPPSVGSRSRPTTDVEAVELAQQSLRAGRPSDALAALDDFERGFPSSPLLAESTYLRASALSAAGAHDAARTTAKRFLERRPDSVYAPRMRELVKP
jgi:hypothetical protein